METYVTLKKNGWRIPERLDQKKALVIGRTSRGNIMIRIDNQKTKKSIKPEDIYESLTTEDIQKYPLI